MTWQQQQQPRRRTNPCKETRSWRLTVITITRRLSIVILALYILSVGLTTLRSIGEYKKVISVRSFQLPGNVNETFIPRRTPRIAALDLPLHKKLQSSSYYPITKPIQEDDGNYSISDAPPLIDQSWFTHSNAREYSSNDYNTSVCEPMHEWQLESYPNCNLFHELEPRKLRMINKGGARIAFEAKQYLDNTELQFVYKTIKYSKSVSERKVEEQRKDALALGRASGSKFIPDIHGYCSVAIMMPFMPEGNLHDYIKSERLAGESQLPPVDKLRIAIHIASSVADLHTVSAFFHRDLCCHQFLFQDGIFKLNDFNMAGLLYVNKTNNNHRCTGEYTENSKYIWKGRSLEEFQLALQYENYTAPEPEAVDVWMMGNLIYTTLTDLYIFEKPQRLNAVSAARKLVLGELPSFPKEILDSTDPSHLAVIKALQMCWTYEWQNRPSARSISQYLLSSLREITGEVHPDVRVVLPERDANQKGTDSDWQRANCDHTEDGKVKNNCM